MPEEWTYHDPVGAKPDPQTLCELAVEHGVIVSYNIYRNKRTKFKVHGPKKLVEAFVKDLNGLRRMEDEVDGEC